MNRTELELMTLDELYRTALAQGVREAAGLPREAVIARLLGELPPPARPSSPTAHTRAAGAPTSPDAGPATPDAKSPSASVKSAPTAGSLEEPSLAAVAGEAQAAAHDAVAATGAQPPSPAPQGDEAHAHREPFGMLDLEELPERYGVDECEVIARDPHLVFVYWEVTEDGLAAARRDLGDEAATARLVMRLIATAGPGERGPEREVRDHALDWNHGRRYFPAQRSGARVRAAVGLVTTSGLFAPIAHSSQVRVPPAEPAQLVSAEWMEVEPGAGAAVKPSPIVVVHRGPERGERGIGLPHASSQSASQSAEQRPARGESESSSWRWRPGSQG